MTNLIAAPPEYISITYSDEVFNCSQEDSLYYKNILLPFANSELYYGEVTRTKLLTSGEDVKPVYDIGINTENIKHDYRPGDTIGIIPSNSDGEINKLLNRISLTNLTNKTYTISILPNTRKKKPTIPSYIPVNSSLKILFTRNLDVRSIPKKLFLRTLSDYTADEAEKQKLLSMCSPAGSSEYNNFINNEGKTLLGILETFPSCQPPIERILEHIPNLKPRPYSLVSSPLSNKNEIHFAVSVLNEGTKGVCSRWLEHNIQHGNNFKIPFYFRKGNSFKLPEDSSRPIIMVGPGTGVAPFIGFLEQRLCLATNDDKNEDLSAKIGQSWLFFGCRYSQRDFLYKDQITKYLHNKILTKLFTSFSRESENKSYVQQKILENGLEFVNLLLDKNALFYVCGDAKNMRLDVKNAVVECLVKFAGKDVKEAEDLVVSWQKSNTYIEDIWI